MQMTNEMKILNLQLELEKKKTELLSLQAANKATTTETKANKFDLHVLEAMCGKFGGLADDNVTKWFLDLEKSMDLLECVEQNRIIAARYMLTGAARRFAEVRGIYNYEQLKAALQEEFGMTASGESIYQRLRNRKLKKNESPKQYILEMRNIAAQGHIGELELVDLIVEGLNCNMVQATMLSAVTSVSELKHAIERLECRGQEWLKQRSNIDNQMTEVRCYNCFMYGHYQTDCKKPKRPPNSCFVCSEVGHTRHECPRRVRKRAVGAVKPDVEERVKPYNDVSIFFCNKRGFYENKILNALFDTGSPVSFIQRTDVAQQLINREMTTFYRGMGGRRIQTKESVEAKIKFQNEAVVHKLSIIPDEQAIHPLVIGRDLLNKMNITLIKTKRIKYEYTKNELTKLNKNYKLNCTINKNLKICKHSEIKLDTDAGKHVGAINRERENMIKHYEENRIFTKEEILGNEIVTGEWEANENSVQDDKHININPDLNTDDRNTIKLIIEKHYKPPNTRIKELEKYAMRIQLTDDIPVYSYPRKLSFKQKQEVQVIIDDLLKENIIRPSKSPYASPIVLVSKKSGKSRMCVDYRALNKKTVRDNFPLPLIEDCLIYLSGKNIFTTLDLKNGFHQVPLHEESIPLTAFVTPTGQYEYCYMPFGLANAPPVFQRYISAVLEPLIKSGKIVVYLDDILVATRTMREQLTVLTEVLEALSKGGLFLNFTKCKFGYNELEYLGYCVNKNGIRPNEQHLKAINDYKAPTNAKEVQRVIGLFSYFRRFVPDFSRIASPLHNLVRKNAVFEWTEECQNAFHTLKQKLMEAPVLSIFHPDRETELHTDASSKGFGAVLLQKQDDQKFHPVAFYSRTTTDAEVNYHSFELETLAIVYALERFRSFLDGIKFVIVTDCNSLVLTLEKKYINPRIARWTLGLPDFDFTVKHRKSEQMQHVDALSRGPTTGAVEENEVDINIQIVQSQDPMVVQLKQKLENEEVEGYVLDNGLVFHVGKDGLQLYVPKAMERNIMQLIHENYGHQGIDKCVNQMQKHYWFPHMRKKLNNFIKNCLKCIYYAGLPRSNQRNLYNIPKKPVPFDTIHIDHFGPLEAVESKHKHILAVVDSFTKFVKLYAVNTGAKETICSLKKYFNSYSRPKRIISDRGTCFTSEEFKKFCSDNNIVHVLNAVASPQSNGQVERVNRVIKAMLAKVTNPWTHSDWSNKLTDVEFAVNNTVHTATRETPSKLLFGVEQRGRIVDELTEYLDDTYVDNEINLTERRERAEEAMNRAQNINQRNFEKTHTEPKQFSVGELVVIKNVDTTVGKNKKLIQKYKDPYVIRKKLSHDRYIVTDVGNCQVSQIPYNGVIDSSRIKKWLNVDHEQNSVVANENTDEDEYTDYEFLEEDDYVNYEFLDDNEELNSTSSIEGD